MNSKIEFCPNLSELSKDFLTKTMCRDVCKRLSASEALQHKWITSEVVTSKSVVAVEFLENMKNIIVGHGVKRMVYNYILSRKMYNHRNINLLKLFELIDTDNSGAIDENELFHLMENISLEQMSRKWNKLEILLKMWTLIIQEK